MPIVGGIGVELGPVVLAAVAKLLYAEIDAVRLDPVHGHRHLRRRSRQRGQV